MKKIFMIVDSFSGLTQKEAIEKGWGYIPQIVIINGKSYKDGIDIFMEDSVDLIRDTKDFKTSVPAIGEVIDIIEENAAKYDEVFYWPMNKGVSSTFDAVSTVARDFDNVHVIDSKMYSTPLQNTITKFKEMLENGKSLEECFAFAKDINDKTIQYIIPKDVSAFIKSGRLKGAKKTILEKGKLIPKLKWTDNGLKITTIKKSFIKMVKKTVNQIKDDLPNPDDYDWQVVHTGDMKTKQIAIDAIKEVGYIPSEKWIPPVVSVHIGVGGIGISVFPKIK